MSYVINRLCGNTVLALRVVVSDPNGHIVHASNLNPSHVYAILGIAITGGVYGQYATIQYTGVIMDPAWNWNHGYPVYLSDDGVLTQIQPTEGFIYQIGYATTPHELALRMALISAVENDFPYRTAITDSAMGIGQPIYVKSSGNVDLAASTELTLASAIGLSTSIANAGEYVRYTADGVVTQTDWTGVTNTVALEIGKPYYLSALPGKLTTVIPTSGFILRVGVALTESDLDVEFSSLIQI